MTRHGFSRRVVLKVMAAAGLSCRADLSFSAPFTLLVPTSLQDELAQALKASQPLVLMVSLDGCPFCKIARENYLAPLVREQGLRVVQINMQHKEAVKDVLGVNTTQEQLIAELGVTVAPTLIFYGPAGREIAERLVGIGSEDFYGAYLDQRVATARSVVRAVVHRTR
jgi:thioredoxin-related protein